MTPTPPLPTALQTLKSMLTALGILFLGVSVFAYGWGRQSPWSMPELDSEKPAELLRELRQDGIDCQRRESRPELYDCTYRAPGGGQTGERSDPPRSAIIEPA